MRWLFRLWTDIVELIGLGFVVTGVALMHVPAALCVAGVGLVALVALREAGKDDEE